MASGRALSLSRKQRYDLVIVCTMPDAVILCALPLRLFGTKVLLDIHDTMPELYRDKFGGRRGALGARLLMLEERMCGWLADRVLAVHEPHARRLEQAGISPEKITVVLNAPDPGIFGSPVSNGVGPRTKANRADAPFTLICHGTITRRLGVDVAIQAVNLLRDRLPLLRLRIVGISDSDFSRRVRDLAAGLELDGRVTLEPAVPIERLPSLLCQASVGLVPNRASSACDLMLPAKLLEYAALGIPAIAARLRTIQHYFGDAVRYFEPGNPSSLADAIEAFYHDPGERQMLATRARQVIANLAWPIQRARYYEAVDSLLPNSRNRCFPLRVIHGRLRSPLRLAIPAIITRRTRMASQCEAVIVGSGPHGLAAAAHLRAAGVEARVFGGAMSFWQDHMPKGMFLRSSWEASHVADPRNAFTLDCYETAAATRIAKPVPLDAFVQYGLWFQRRVVPDLDTRKISRIEPAPLSFCVRLEDGETFEAQRIVVAAGIAPFAYRPPELDGLPASLASHSRDHRDLGIFARLRTIVIGAGQSALESAALLREAGADVEVLVRSSRVRWNVVSGKLHGRTGLVRRLLYPPTDVGPPGLNQIVARPALFRSLPPRLRQRIAYRCIRPAVSDWVMPRVRGVRIATSRRIVSARSVGDKLCLTLNDGTQRQVDHVLMATGYRIDISRYGFLAPELVRAVRRIDGYPVLSTGFESSVPGLYFVGAPAARIMGPVMRFVSGSGYGARAVTQSVLRGSRGHRNGNYTARNGASGRVH